MTGNRGKVALLAIIFMALFTTHASAHSQIISQFPEPDSSVIELPQVLQIVFNENLLDLGDGNDLQMLDPQGDEITTGEISIVDATLSRALNPSTLPGEYYVSYRAVSADGHVVAGEYTFTVAPELVVVQPAPLISSPPTATDSSNLGKVVAITSLGLALCGFIFWRFRVRESRITSSH